MNIIHTSHYRFGFDIWGLLLFLLVMAPNFIWFAVPAPNDILRTESVTPVVDIIGSVFQVLTVACLCFVIHKSRSKLRFSSLIVATIICIAIYYIGWVLYYTANVSPHRHPPVDRPTMLGIHPFRRRPQESSGRGISRRLYGVPPDFRGGEFCVKTESIIALVFSEIIVFLPP